MSAVGENARDVRYGARLCIVRDYSPMSPVFDISNISTLIYKIAIESNIHTISRTRELRHPV